MTYSAWLAQTARKEFTLRAGLAAVADYELEHGAFTPVEFADADQWAAAVTSPAGGAQTATRKST